MMWNLLTGCKANNTGVFQEDNPIFDSFKRVKPQQTQMYQGLLRFFGFLLLLYCSRNIIHFMIDTSTPTSTEGKSANTIPGNSIPFR
jgi:hypothetical protein